jgi:hypothetical protein
MEYSSMIHTLDALLTPDFPLRRQQGEFSMRNSHHHPALYMVLFPLRYRRQGEVLNENFSYIICSHGTVFPL